MNTGKALLGVLVGIAAGAALGMIFGNDKQGKIAKKGEDLSDALNEKIDKKFEDLLSNITGKVKGAKAKNDINFSKQEAEA